MYHKLYPDYIDQEHPFLKGFKVLEFTLCSRYSKMTTLEHVTRFTYHCGDALGDDFMKLHLFPSLFIGITFNYYLNLPPNSIFSWWDIQNVFQAQFVRSNLSTLVVNLARIKQKVRELAKEFLLCVWQVKIRC